MKDVLNCTPALIVWIRNWFN